MIPIICAREYARRLFVWQRKIMVLNWLLFLLFSSYLIHNDPATNGWWAVSKNAVEPWPHHTNEHTLFVFAAWNNAYLDHFPDIFIYVYLLRFKHCSPVCLWQSYFIYSCRLTVFWVLSASALALYIGWCVTNCQTNSCVQR